MCVCVNSHLYVCRNTWLEIHLVREIERWSLGHHNNHACVLQNNYFAEKCCGHTCTYTITLPEGHVAQICGIELILLYVCHLGWHTLVLKCNQNYYDWLLYVYRNRSLLRYMYKLQQQNVNSADKVLQDCEDKVCYLQHFSWWERLHLKTKCAIFDDLFSWWKRAMGLFLCIFICIYVYICVCVYVLCVCVYLYAYVNACVMHRYM